MSLGSCVRVPVTYLLALDLVPALVLASYYISLEMIDETMFVTKPVVHCFFNVPRTSTVQKQIKSLIPK